MRIIAASALFALAVAMASAVQTTRAFAADNVTVAVGNGGIAFGYSDGYWDQSHKWHNWENKAAADRFRAENKDHYYESKHDSAPAAGWRDNDRYWEHH